MKTSCLSDLVSADDAGACLWTLTICASIPLARPQERPLGIQLGDAHTVAASAKHEAPPRTAQFNADPWRLGPRRLDCEQACLASGLEGCWRGACRRPTPRLKPQPA